MKREKLQLPTSQVAVYMWFSNQFIVDIRAKFEEILSRFSCDITFIRTMDATLQLSWTLNLWPTKSNQFIPQTKWMFVQTLKKCPQGVPEVLC